MWILTLRFLLLKIRIQFTTVSAEYLPFPIALYPNMLLFLHVWEPYFNKQTKKQTNNKTTKNKAKKNLPFPNLATLSGNLPKTKQETNHAYLTTCIYIQYYRFSYLWVLLLNNNSKTMS